MPEPETYGFPDPFQYTSVADLAHPGYAAADLRRLAGDLPRDDESWPLEPGRLRLYVCPIDGDLACGAVTVAVTHGRNETTWSDFRLEDGYTDDEIGLDLSALGPLAFPRAAYREALLEPVGVSTPSTPSTPTIDRPSSSTGAAPHADSGNGFASTEPGASSQLPLPAGGALTP